MENIHKIFPIHAACYSQWRASTNPALRQAQCERYQEYQSVKFVVNLSNHEHNGCFEVPGSIRQGTNPSSLHFAFNSVTNPTIYRKALVRVFFPTIQNPHSF